MKKFGFAGIIATGFAAGASAMRALLLLLV
jgi:hypothetical protein